MDFNAWFEAFLGDRWFTFDARHSSEDWPHLDRARPRRRRHSNDHDLWISYAHALHRGDGGDQGNRIDRRLGLSLKKRESTMMTILLIILIIVLLGGGGGYYAHGRSDAPGLGGVLGLVLIILIVLWLVGALTTGVGPRPI